MRIFKVLGFFAVAFLFYFFGKGMVSVFMNTSDYPEVGIKHFVKHEILSEEDLGETKTHNFSVYQEGCIISWLVHSFPNKKVQNLQLQLNNPSRMECHLEKFIPVHRSIILQIFKMWDYHRFLGIKIKQTPRDKPYDKLNQKILKLLFNNLTLKPARIGENREFTYYDFAEAE